MELWIGVVAGDVTKALSLKQEGFPVCVFKKKTAQED